MNTRPVNSELSFLESFITTLHSSGEIRERCVQLGEEITGRFRGRSLVVVGVLKGVFPFYADLVREIRLPCRCDFLGLSSYGSATESSGVIRMTSDISIPVEGRDVLVVEDIVDTGLTMEFLLANLGARSPKSISVCTLLHKPSRSRVKVPLHYVGFTIPDHFVIGYGLDYDDRLRNLSYIGYFGGEVPELPE